MTELEAAIAADPDVPDAYLVFADYLQAQGDPRGELIVAQHQGRDAAPLLEQHRAAFLGPLADFGDTVKPKYRSTSRLVIGWRWGFIESLDLGWENAWNGGKLDECNAQLAAILAHPSCRFLRRLRVGPTPGDADMSFDPVTDAIAEVGCPLLRELELGDIGHWDISGTRARMDRISAACPRLETMVLRGGDLTIGPIDLPRLRSFTVETGSLTEENIADLCAAKWPALERLAIWFGDENYGASGRVGDIAPILEARGLPKLRHLGLMNCPWIDEVIEPLAGSAVLPQLATLDLSMGALSDAGLATLVRHASAFAHLTSINVNDNALTDASTSVAAGSGLRIELGSEQDPDRADDPDPGRRYCAVGE